ncbi:FAD binding domain-containing protein [Paenibacillus campi]|uniref:FAD binding domain-containing protein n=1 Tax=Paenibacillus campi TaxID=3106031 RepID=UPI002AFFC5A3|nr:FAD binding domain-containing protein [Paenibacillus sp. SGZ-1014]
MNTSMSHNDLPPVYTPIVWEPADAEEAITLKRQHGADAVWVAGGTLLRTQWEGGIAPLPKHMIRLDTLAGICAITEEADYIEVGALATLKQCGQHAALQQYANTLYVACRHIAAPAVRNVATIGGNVASAVGDALPALLVHDASLLWADGEHTTLTYEQAAIDWIEQVRAGRRSLQAVLLGIRFAKLPTLCGQALELWQEGTVVSALDMAPNAVSYWRDDSGKRWHELCFFRKLGRREAFTPSLVTVALRCWMSEQGELTQARVAAGGGSGLAMRLLQCEALLEGRSYDAAWLPELAATAAQEFVSYSDPFAEAAYRQQSAGNLLAAGLWESIQELAEGR